MRKVFVVMIHIFYSRPRQTAWRILTLCFAFCVYAPMLHAQHNMGSGAAETLYVMNCAGCHGNVFRGRGERHSVIGRQRKFNLQDKDIFDVIKYGNAKLGMPAWEKVLSNEQIRSLVILIHEQQKLSGLPAAKHRNVSQGLRFTSRYHAFELERVGKGTHTLWSIDFLPNGDFLVTQKNGILWLFSGGKRVGPIKKTPKVLYEYQGGLLDVKIHPDYAKNAWVYLSYTKPSKNGSMTAVVRGKIDGEKWTNEEEVFSVPAKYHTDTGHHYGSRFVLKNGYIFFGIGDRGKRGQAQDLTRPNGKIHRLHDSGLIPPDNPFLNEKKAYHSIWSLGHRNPQGLALHPVTNEVWSSELGPRGGDEINLIRKGKNYGWPIVTFGMNYDGTPITSMTESEIFEQPRYHWTPSISPSGIEFYQGGIFPLWKNSLFVAGMGSEELHRLEIRNNKVVADEIVLRQQGRIRDIAVGTDGYLYLLINTTEPLSGSIYRLIPGKIPFTEGSIKKRY